MNSLRFAAAGQLACMAAFAVLLTGCGQTSHVVPPAPVADRDAPAVEAPPPERIIVTFVQDEPPVVAPPREVAVEPPVAAPAEVPTVGPYVAAAAFATRQLVDYERTVLPPPKLYVTDTGSHFHSPDCPHVRKSRIPITPEKARRYYEPCTACGGLIKEHEVRVDFQTGNYDPGECEWTFRGTVNDTPAVAIVFVNREERWTSRRLTVAGEVVLRDDGTPSQSRLWDERLRTAAQQQARREQQAQRETAERLRQAREDAAAAKLGFARVFLLQNRKDTARRYLQEILEDYADTPSAAGARELLKEIGLQAPATSDGPGNGEAEGPCAGAP